MAWRKVNKKLPMRKVPRKQIQKKKAAPIRSRAAQVLAPSTGATTRRPFGSAKAHLSGKGGSALACWDAKIPTHLPLPRAVGPYLTVRTTKRLSTNDPLVLFGTFKHCGLASEQINVNDNWANTIGWSVPKTQMANTPSAAANNINAYTMDLTGFGHSAQCVPAAMTVQVMNPNSLQETCGMIYGTVMTTQIKPHGALQSFQEMADGMIQFMNPRLMAAPKLALRGVQASSYPLNMAEVSDFKEIFTLNDGTHYIDAFEGLGWAPIVFFNPDCGTHPGPALEFLVTVEWRVRFDTSNPASAGHIAHPVATDATWSKTMQAAAKLGSGMVDIADVVANTGLASVAGKAMRMFG